MPKQFELLPDESPTYYGRSDLLCQIADELRNRPDSCFAKNVVAWYNAEYSALSDLVACEYQVEINEALCPENENTTPETIEDIVDLIGAFTEGKTRRVAQAAIRIACREALRQNIERTSQNVLPP